MRTDRIVSLKICRGMADDGESDVRCLNNRLEDMADIVKSAIKSDNLDVNLDDFSPLYDNNPSSDTNIVNAQSAISNEIDACTDADVQEALAALREMEEKLKREAEEAQRAAQALLGL